MDCETCNDLLLDLAYGELDEVRAAAVRKHADACVECRDALRRITRGRALVGQLPLESPPPVGPALQAAIAAHCAAVSAGARAAADAPAAGVVELPTSRSRLARWIDRVGEVAMRRQVAMAAVFVLMIGVGLVFYQTHPRPTDAQDDHVPDVVPAVEVSGGPSARPGTPPTPATARRVASPLSPGRQSSGGYEREESRARGAVAHGPSTAPAPARSAALARADSRAESATVAPHVAAEEAERIAPQGAAAGTTAEPGAPSDDHDEALAAASNREVARVQANRGSEAVTAPAARAEANGAPTQSASWAVAAANGRSAAARNDLPTAAAQLRVALSAAPDDVTRARLALELAQVLRRAGHHAEAVAVLGQVRGTPEQTARAQEQLAELNSPASTEAGNNNSVMMRRAVRRPAASSPAPSGGPMRGRPARAAPPRAADFENAL